MNNVTALSIGDSKIFYLMCAFCINSGAIYIANASFQTVNCNRGILSDECNTRVLNCIFNGAGLIFIS